MQCKKPHPSERAFFVVCVALLLTLVISAQSALAQTFKVLHTFHGRDGGSPMGQLVLDTAGNIYGTTIGGGEGKCNAMGCGTVFKLTRSGKQVWMYSFQGTNGYNPDAGLLRDGSGNLFGTTVNGGRMTKGCIPTGGCGVVFELDSTGKKESVLYKFAGTSDGDSPESLLVEDPTGNLYGTTVWGGASGLGTVFKIDPNHKETVLHSFAGPPDGGGDGAYSYQGVVQDAAGNEYGVTDAGGAYADGVVYELNAKGKETLLYSFTGGEDGGGPNSVLLEDSAGNLYGTTKEGGNSECGGSGCGVIFELSPQSGGQWSESVLYTFCSLKNCADGERPLSGPLVMDAAGNLYGTTYFGGTFQNCNGDTCGVVFKLDTTGKETVLHSFTGGADGALPYAGLTIDGAGNLYGTTQAGGTSCYTSYTCGVVFKIAP
jgi:uncharacterized repeat protein (TIGR03803 family)